MPIFKHKRKTLANIFGVSIDYLFGIENDQKEIDMLKKTLIEAGFDVNDDLSMEDLKKALIIVNVMKDTK